VSRWTGRLKKLERQREKRRRAREYLQPCQGSENATAIAARNQAQWVSSRAFLDSAAWSRLRMEVLTHYGPRCMCCGAATRDGAVMNVDHIKPRRKYPELALSFENLQVLCALCNKGKGNWDETDWRPQQKSG
jgi:5-methylcytosine-specific restriction endonuclease McrA